MAKDRVVSVLTTGTRVEYSTDGSDWNLIPGASEWDSSGGDAPVTSEANFLQSDQSVGQITPPTITISIAPLVPIHPAFKAISDARDASRSLWFRYTTPQEQVLAEAAAARTAAIAIGGKVTFAGTDTEDAQKERWTTADYSIGLALRIGGTLYPVSEIETDGEITVVDADGDALTASVNAGAYSVVRPGMRQSMLARVVSSPATAKNLPTGGRMTGTLIVAPSSVPNEALPVYA